MSFHSISFRSTKIVATLGPLSDIRSFVQNGVDVFRINASHGTHVQYKTMIETIRSLEKEYEKPLPILFDLQGPKLRIGHFSDPEISLEKNDFFTLDLNTLLGDKTRVCFPHPEFYSILFSGSFLLLNDGKVRLEVLETDPTSIKTRVIIGGVLSSCKGVNIPSTFLPINTLTEKDHNDLLFALDHGIDFIGLSFVQTKEDVIRIRNIAGDRAQLLSKIEKPSAIENLAEIIDISDGIMVARGDLGVELPIEEVPFLQKIILKEARKKGKPVIVATQMLESMILSPSPTRAEVSDVATAVMEGADAVCLSAESATGHYPLEAISMMDRIIQAQEKHKIFYEDQSVECTADAMAISAKQLSKSLNLPLIVTLSEKGFTTLRMARQRPSSQIISLSSSLSTVRHMSLVWGTKCFLVSEVKNRSQDITKFIQDKLQEKNNMLVFSRFEEDLETKDQEFQINVVVQNALF